MCAQKSCFCTSATATTVQNLLSMVQFCAVLTRPVCSVATNGSIAKADHPRIHAFSYAFSRDNDGRHSILSAIAETPCNTQTSRLCVLKTGVIDERRLREWRFSTFCSHNLDLELHPITFICELDSYSREIHRICKYELPTSRLSKVIVRQNSRLVRPNARRFAGGQLHSGQ